MANKKATKRKTSTKSNRTAFKAVGDRNAEQATPTRKRPVKKRTTTPTTKSAATNSAKPGFPIVGVGASAGGLEAMEELLNNMPTDTGMAFVIVTRQHPAHTTQARNRRR